MITAKTIRTQYPVALFAYMQGGDALCYAIEYPRDGKRYETRFQSLDLATAAFDAKLAEIDAYETAQGWNG